MRELVLALYIISALASIAVCRLIYKTKNGGLKRSLLFLFGVISFSLLARFVSGWFDFDKQATSLTLMAPFTIAISTFAIYLYKNHKP